MNQSHMNKSNSKNLKKSGEKCLPFSVKDHYECMILCIVYKTQNVKQIENIFHTYNKSM